MDAIANIHQRLAEAMRAVSYVQKSKPKGMQYSIVSHDAVTAKVRPALLDAGIVYYPVDMAHAQNGNRTEIRLSVRFANIDDPKDCIDVPALGYGVDTSDKGPGKPTSYAVKYALLKALGLETGEDADLSDVPHEPEADPSDDVYLLKAAVAANRLVDSIGVIREAIAEFEATGDPSALSPGAEAFGELSEEDKRAIWVAPTKMEKAGLPVVFTTREREIMKMQEFREAHFGDVT